LARLRLSALFVFLLAGCAPDLPSFDPAPQIKLPADLDRYLADSEKQVVGLKPGTEKSIRWYRGVKKKTPLSIIYFHGFSASRRESSPVVEQVADALGANVFFTRFKGHGMALTQSPKPVQRIGFKMPGKRSRSVNESAER
jgi:hypothetical protein